MRNADAPTPAAPPRRRRRWQIWVLGILAAGLMLVAGLAVWLDTSAGHRFLVARISGIEPQSGLRIGIERIDGSIYGKARLRGVRLSDPGGIFLSAPDVRLDWWPVAWLYNRLDIDMLDVPVARLHKLPHFIPSKAKRPLLPDFDIRLMRLNVGRLFVDRAVVGRADVMTMAGDADVRSGRAVVDLSARSLSGDDRLLLALDSRPDDNRFDVDVTVNAPRGGVLAGVAGVKQDANLRLKGDGDWKLWKGSLVATLGGSPAAGFSLKAQEGRYSLVGALEGRALGAQGMLARIAVPQLRIEGGGTFANRRLSGRMEMHSEALAMTFVGGLDLRANSYDNLAVDAHVLRPEALLKRMGGRDILARMRIDGPFAQAQFEYLVTANQLRFDKTVLQGVRARGTGHLGTQGTALIPLDLTAQRVDGQGDVIGAILRNFRLTGQLQKKGGIITSSPLALRSDKFDGKLVALVDLKSGRYDLALSGDIRALLVPGLGVVDLRSAVKAVPDARGAFGLRGTVEATMRRLDNGFLRSLAGGLPRLRSDLALGPDGRLRFTALDLRAPAITLHGSGQRLPGGEVQLSGAGTHRQYGPLRLTLAGRIDRPKIDLLLARPMDAAGLRQVHVLLDPNPSGYLYRAEGGSTLGPFVSGGHILLPRGGQSVIAVERLAIDGASARGELRPVTGGLSGRLDISGDVTGFVALAPVNGVQQITTKLIVNNARFDGPVAIAARRGALDATLLLDPGGTTIDAKVDARGLQIGKMRANRLIATSNLKDGTGKLQANVTGQRGRLFDLRFDVDITPDQWLVNAGGTLDRQPIRLNRAARISRAGAGWLLDSVTLSYRGGSVRVSGEAGGADTRLDLAFSRMPLSLLDISNSNLGLGGLATGKIHYVRPRGAQPTGSAQMQVKGLTRSGVTRTSAPIDIGVNGVLTADRLALRALAASNGTIIGRGQALLAPLGAGSIVERLENAPVQAQLRYSGPAEALWRLSGVEIVDLGGAVTLSANVRGTLAQPAITGSVATNNATFVSPITGMNVTGLRSIGQFDGSQLVLRSFEGQTRGGGKVSGSGRFDFSAVQGIGIDLTLQATNAEMLNRDDLGAYVTGPITIRSDGNGGVIGGNLDVARSRFTLGRAAAVAQIPELQVIEKNGRRGGDDFDPPVVAKPWTLDMKARARNRLMVDGMGLNSEWRMTMDIGGNVTAPVLTGTAEMVRGSYDFAGRRFDLTDGTLRFDGRTPVNPTLDITAEASVSDLSATIRVTGTSMNPIIGFTSVPALPEDEVLSRILFGSSITQLSAPEALQLAGAVASLQGKGGGLDPINAVRKLAGLDRLRILPADTTTGQGTSVAVGKYITRKTYVELVSDGQGYSATRIEYQITRWLSLLGSISTIGRQSASVRVSKDY